MQEYFGVEQDEMQFVLLDINQAIGHTLDYLKELRETVFDSEFLDTTETVM